MSAKQALAIGNNAYVLRRLALRPCINDANDLSNSLRSIGFQVHCKADLDLNSMKSMTRRFVESIQPGNNYLIPIDSLGICEDNIKSTAIDAQKLINSMYEKRPKLIICILDCCRTDPPETPLDRGKNSFDRVLGGTRAGFAPMRAPPSTIIVYACAADEAASPKSKNGRNSLYTYHLLRYIKTPNVDIETILRHTAADVQRDSNNEQIPYRYSSCNEMVYLVSDKGQNAPLSPQYIQAMPVVQPLNKIHQNPDAHHPQLQQNNFQHILSGQFSQPINPLVGQYPAPHMMINPFIVQNPAPHMKLSPLVVRNPASHMKINHLVAQNPAPHMNINPLDVGVIFIKPKKEPRHHRR